MSSRKMGGIIFGIATIIVIGYSIFKVMTGKEFGFNEIMTIAICLMMFFSAITWGNKEEKDGVYQKDELGQKITEKSSKISYFILIGLILIAVFVDELVNGTVNMFLLIILGLSMVILPLVEFITAKKYQ